MLILIIMPILIIMMIVIIKGKSCLCRYVQHQASFFYHDSDYHDVLDHHDDSDYHDGPDYHDDYDYHDDSDYHDESDNQRPGTSMPGKCLVRTMVRIKKY